MTGDVMAAGFRRSRIESHRNRGNDDPREENERQDKCRGEEREY